MVIIEILENWCACSCMWNVWLLLVELVFESFVCLVLEGTCFLESYVSVNLWGWHFDIQLESYWKKYFINILLVLVNSHYLTVDTFEVACFQELWEWEWLEFFFFQGLLLLPCLSADETVPVCDFYFFFCFRFCRALTIKFSCREGICLSGWAN